MLKSRWRLGVPSDAVLRDQVPANGVGPVNSVRMTGLPLGQPRRPSAVLHSSRALGLLLAADEPLVRLLSVLPAYSPRRPPRGWPEGVNSGVKSSERVSLGLLGSEKGPELRAFSMVAGTRLESTTDIFFRLVTA